MFARGFDPFAGFEDDFNGASDGGRQQQRALGGGDAGRRSQPVDQSDHFMNQEMGQGMGQGFFGQGIFGGSLFGPMESTMSGGGAGGGMQSMTMSSSAGGGGGGSFKSQSFVQTTTVGPDGVPRTERFAQSTVGDGRTQRSETQQAYSDSREAVEKMAVERHAGERAHKHVRHVNKADGEEHQTQLFRGMDENGLDVFNEKWRGSKEALPAHGNDIPRFMRGDNCNHRALAGAGGQQQQQQQRRERRRVHDSDESDARRSH